MSWVEHSDTFIDLYLLNSPYAVDAFKPAFRSFFGEEHQTFKLKMFHNLDQLRLQLERENLHGVRQRLSSSTQKQFKESSASKGVNATDLLNLKNLDTLEAVIHKVVNTYGVLRMKENEVNALKENGKHENNDAFRQTESETNIARQEEKVNMREAVDAGIRPVIDKVQLLSYDTHLLETIESNTTPTSTNMCHRGGEIDQDALLKTELLKTKDMVDKEIYNELSKRFLQLEKHCISLEIQIQQKEEAQLQAKTTLICNLKNQIKSVKEASNEAKVKNDIDVIKTINIKLEHSVAKLLAANEQLHKENEHLKQTYKELYDSIKKTRAHNKDNSDSLISQINQKSVKNADLKAQIQEKVFSNAALKNELRKLKGNSVDTKFAKPSIMGKPFAFQVDVNNVLSKPVTPHYLPKVREYVLAKSHHMIAPGSSRNSQDEYYGSNDMAHNHYLEKARKKTQERNRNSKPSVMPSVRLQNTVNGSTPNPKRTSQTSRSLPTSKSSCVTIMVVPKADHSRNSSSFSDSKHFFCSTCHKCIFNANHNACITKLLNEVNSRKIPTGKMFIDSTTKVDSEPPNGSNEDITNPYECDQTLNVSACTLNLSAAKGSKDSNLMHINNDVCSHQFRTLSSTTNGVRRQHFRPHSLKKIKYFKPSPNVDHPVLEVPTPVPAASTSSPSSTTVNQDAPSTSTSQTTSEQQSSVILQEPSSEETTNKGSSINCIILTNR
ncbi:hypothetical protein Tco_1546620 [Tanacetum coccineum]